MIHVRAGDPRVLITPPGTAPPPDWEPGGTDRRLDRAGDRAGAHDDGLLVVVEDGPDTGLAIPLPRGGSFIGRGPCRVRLRDPLVSRRHAELIVGPDGVRLRAEARTLVNGRVCEDTCVDVGSSIEIGRDHLRLLARAPTWHAAGACTDGAWDHFDSPHPPPPPRPVIAAVTAVAPLAIGVVMVAVMGSWLMLLFGLVGVLTGGVNFVDVCIKRRRHRLEERREARARAKELSDAHPAPGTWVASFRNRTGSAMPDAVSSGGPRTAPSVPPAVRLGRCLQPALRTGGGSTPTRRHGVELLPALCAPGAGQDIRLLGPPDRVSAAVRAMALAWLPMPGCRLSVAALDSLPARILAQPRVSRTGPLPTSGNDPLLIWTGSDGRSNRVFTSTHDAGRADAAAPGELVVDLRRGTIPGGDGDLIRFLPESLSFEGCVIALAACPGCDDPATDERSPDTGLRAVLGHGEDSVVAPDLVRDGPHALVAGTTGSGKSVLLTTWLTSLAAHRPPDRLRLILLDFKGGATFGSWQHDPHVEALVTDLNREDAQRVLEGIRHELTRREEVLRERGVADVCELPEQERPARIVVVVDEFRLLAESVPSILQDLLRCATVGRSLGLHLILATQRPQGVVSAEIRANVSLTICLRLTSELDASDLIGATDPAHFSSTRPGTAALRSGAGPLQVFTVAQVDPGDGATVGATTSLACSIVVGPTCADIEELADAEDPPAAATHRMTATPETFIAPPLPLRLDRVCVPPDGAAPSDTAVLGLRATPSRLVPFKYAPHRDGSLTVEAAPGPQRNAMVSAWLDAFSRARWGQACVVLDGDGITTDETFPGLILGRDQLPDAAEAIRALAEGRTAGAGGRAVLVITSPTAWFGTGTDSGAASFEDSVTALATTGRCPIVLVRGRESAGSRIAAQAPQHLYLPWSIPPESRMLWPSLRPCTPIPGRGVLLGPDTGDKGDPVHCLAQDSPSRPRHSRDGHPITGWVSLPTRVEGHALAVRSLDLAPLSWTPTSNCAAVLGGPGSGRTTTLLALHRVLEHSRLIPHNLLCTEPGGVNAPLSPTEDPQQWWLVDDLDDLPAAALNLLAERARSGGNLMVCSRFAGSVPARLTWWHQIDPRTGILLLKPRAADAALLGWRIVEEASAPPGRAWFFPPAAVTPVRAQIALAPGTGSGTGTERR